MAVTGLRGAGHTYNGAFLHARHARGRASTALVNATTESNAERDRVAAWGLAPVLVGAVPVPAPGHVAPPVPAVGAPLVPAGPAAVAVGPATAVTAVAAPVPAGAAPGAAGPGIPPGMPQVKIVVQPASLPRHGSRAGMVPSGALATAVCRLECPAGGPPAKDGPPTSVRIHIITLEDHVMDANCG